MTFDPADPVSQKTKNALGNDLWVVIASDWQLFYKWMQEKGKDPNADKGLSDSVAANYVWRLDQIRRGLWQELDHESTLVTPAQASASVDLLESNEFRTQGGEPYGGNNKRKFANRLQKYAAWKARELTLTNGRNGSRRRRSGNPRTTARTFSTLGSSGG